MTLVQIVFRNAVRLYLVIFVLILSLANGVAGQPLEGRSGKTYTLREFDRGCGEAGHNCQRAFQFAFRVMGRAGGGTLQLPAGTFSIYFPGVAENIPGGVTLAPQNLIVVPPNTTIEGHLAPDGTPDSIIEWRNTSIPTFVFAKANHSGMRNLHLRFTGTMANAYPFGDVALLNAVGYHPTFPHFNQMSGNNGEMFAFAYVFDSDYCTFDHLLFDSATPDNAHTFSMAINLKGKGVVEANGGGLTQLAESNRISNIKIYDFYNAFLVAGQSHFVMENITADRRGSTRNAAPGHVLYTSGTNQWDAAGKLVGALLSTNTTVRNITEGANPLSTAGSGGTLALKFLNGAQISKITSRHPAGLLQTIWVDQNVTFSDMSWSTNYPLCSVQPTDCATPAIFSTASPANLPRTSNLTFENISLTSTASPSGAVLIGDNLRVDSFQITTPPDFLPGQKATNAILSIRDTNGASIKGYVYTPVIDKYDPAARYNSPFTGWNSAKNVSAEVTIKWPSGVSLPEKSTILAGGYQDRSPESNNTIRNSVVKR